jgi:hypothetical protein
MSSFDVIVIREDKDTYTCIFDGVSQEMEKLFDLQVLEITTTFTKKNPGVDIIYDIFFYPNQQKDNWIDIHTEVNDTFEKIAEWHEGDKIDEKRTLHFRFVDMYKGQLEEADDCGNVSGVKLVVI